MAEEKKITPQQRNNHLISSVLLASALLAGVFLQSVLALTQDARQGHMLGSPNSFAGWPSAVLAAYVFFAGPRLRYKFAVVIILTLLAVCTLVWFLGLTSAGESLSNF